MLLNAGFFSYIYGYNFYNLMIKSDINLIELFREKEQVEEGEVEEKGDQVEISRLRSFEYV